MVMPQPSKQAQLEYYYDKRAYLIRKLDNYSELEYPWSLYTQIETLNEQINDIIYGKNRREL